MISGVRATGVRCLHAEFAHSTHSHGADRRICSRVGGVIVARGMAIFIARVGAVLQIVTMDCWGHDTKVIITHAKRERNVNQADPVTTRNGWKKALKAGVETSIVENRAGSRDASREIDMPRVESSPLYAAAVAVVMAASIFAPAVAQSDDLAALDKRIGELLRAGKYADAVPLAERTETNPQPEGRRACGYRDQNEWVGPPLPSPRPLRGG
jgi:hypothetical protein